VIEVAIVRPGPIQGGMVHPYLRRRCGAETVDYPGPEIKKALERTLGVPIFQEQVMQIAILAADFTPGEADALRRAMAAWKRKGGLGPFKDRLVHRMVAKGYPQEFAERIFKQMEGFGEYGFPESHAASFALLVYVSAWIKHNHPDAFLAALLNSQPMGFYAPAQLVRDAKEHGVTVLPVDVASQRLDDRARRLCRAAARRAARLQPHHRLGRGSGENACSKPVPPRALSRAPKTWRGARNCRRTTSRCFAQADALRPAHRPSPPGDVVGGRRRHAGDADAARHPHARSRRPSCRYRVWATPCSPTNRSTGPEPQPAPGGPAAAATRCFRCSRRRCSHTYPAGRLARASGIVTHRQRPETAKGVIFVTLKTRNRPPINVIVWPTVAEAQRRALLASSLLTVYGVWQRKARCAAPGGEDTRSIIRRCCRGWRQRAATFR